MDQETVQARPTPRPGWVAWCGLALVLAAAAALSFDALRHLALAVSIPTAFAWLWPVAVDAGAAVSCAVWLGRRSTPDAARYAGRMTWALLAVTVLGNATALGMAAHGVVPPWWVAALVGAVPPAIVGSTVHLVVLLVRPAVAGPDHQPTDGATGPDRLDEDETGEWTDPWERWGVPAETTPGPDRTAVPDRTGPDRAAGSDRTGPDRDPLHDQVVQWAATLPARPSQRAVRERFNVGATRARRLHEALEVA